MFGSLARIWTSSGGSSAVLCLTWRLVVLRFAYLVEWRSALVRAASFAVACAVLWIARLPGVVRVAHVSLVVVVAASVAVVQECFGAQQKEKCECGCVCVSRMYIHI